MFPVRNLFIVPLLLVVFGCATAPVETPREFPREVPPAPPTEVKSVPPKIALVLGSGAARGFAHIGVIKALEAQGIVPDIIVGTSVGSLIGALYAGGYSSVDLQRVALQLDESMMGDWSLPDRGVFKGEALQNFVNSAVQNRPLEKLDRLFAVVVTDLQSGEQVVFRRGNTGMAVRASSSVPGVFQPVTINGREYVDGGLVSPVPVRVAKSLGAEVVIAVDVSNKPRYGKVNDTIDVLLQAFAIMGQAIASNELPEADVVIRPDTSRIGRADFANRQRAIQEGEQAALATVPLIRQKIAAKSGVAAR
ncbi:MAG: esterase [Betaproteobacteria bacterium RIFCSPLOWO2_12_FULL_62_58]|nr:MAG: esterase [Betaproteobacteria bacterium RIFCSPLOWO2_02_FULL_62_79]OGA55804.1 MAG: esterase [Betaproteobacteria bacterium RIFCSPLOWO2_12_FULL_62_58]